MGVGKHEEPAEPGECRGAGSLRLRVISARLTWSRRSQTSGAVRRTEHAHVCVCACPLAHAMAHWIVLPSLTGHVCLLTLAAPYSRLGVLRDKGRLNPCICSRSASQSLAGKDPRPGSPRRQPVSPRWEILFHLLSRLLSHPLAHPLAPKLPQNVIEHRGELLKPEFCFVWERKG